MGKNVRAVIDDVPPITSTEREELLALSKANTDAIDFSDIPLLPEDAFDNAVRGRFYRPTKQQLTLRIDKPTLDWFRTNAPTGYQTDINRVLGEYVAKQLKKTG